MKNPIFEIKVALIGYVSVGKTTVLNALFREKFGEVSMRRTTAAVNFFCIGGITGCDSSRSTFAQTIEDNVAFRNEDLVCERTFNIALDDPIHTMRDDTKLVIVDVPGVNEAGASTKYADYLSEQWHTFDCIVLVVDGKQGANTEEQLRLLKMVRKHRIKRDVPIIILCNKVDDPDDEEQKLLVDETRAEVERIFLCDLKNDKTKKGVAGRFKASVQSLLDPDRARVMAVNTKENLPTFIPISAIHAFMYRSLSNMPFYSFKQVEPEIIDKLGKENYGTQWKRWDPKQKLTKAYEVIGDESRCREGLSSSNFDEFLGVLRNCIGDEENQKKIIQQQLEIQADILCRDPWNVNVVEQIESINERLCALDKPTSNLPDIFWKVYDKIEDRAFQCIKSPASITSLAGPMDLLNEYLEFVQNTARWENEQEAILARARRLVNRQAGLVMDESIWVKWKLSSMDRALIFGSFLLMSNDHIFCDQFGRLRLVLESLRHEALTWQQAERTSTCPTCTASQLGVKDGESFCYRCKKYVVPHLELECRFCKRAGFKTRLMVSSDSDAVELRCPDCWKSYVCLPKENYTLTYKNGELEATYKEFYKKHVKVVVPESIADPSHFGYLSWRCCHLFRLVRGNQS